jgi:hypothetical protein
MAWVVSVGRSSLVPDSLVVVNVLALALLGWVGGLLALHAGRHPLWGLTLPAYWGYLWSLGRDLTEITTAAALMGGLYLFRRQRWLAAAACLLVAVLCKETAAYAVDVVGAIRLIGWVRHRDRPFLQRTDLTWAVPLGGFAAWQVTVASLTGTAPLLASGGANLGVPFGGFVRAVGHYTSMLPAGAAWLWWGELGLLTALTVCAGRVLWRSAVLPHERALWAAAVALVVCASHGIWLGDVGFRSLDLLYLFNWLVMLHSNRRSRVALAGTALAWIVVFVELVLFI